MAQRRLRKRSFLRVGCAIALLVACAAASYAAGVVEGIGAIAYRNTSPPLASTTGGVTLALAHARYLTVETITLTLTNQSDAPIYVPATSTDAPRSQYVSVSNLPALYSCLAIETEVLGAHGWRTLGRGCDWSWSCPSGEARALSEGATLIIQPYQTAVFPLYDGQSTYPTWQRGSYRFSVLFSRTPFQAPRFWPDPIVIPQGELLVTAPVTLTSPWWIPSWYHHTPPRCPVVY